MSFTADIEGFKDAQRRLVAQLGTPVVFTFAPTSYTYGSGVYLDPETGEALDPTATPVSSVVPSAITASATILRSVPAAANEGDAEKAGIIPEGKAWLRIPAGTYNPSILAARECTFHGETFACQRFVVDGIGSAADRLYVELDYSRGGLSAPAPSGIVTNTGAFVREVFTATAGQTTFTVAVPFSNGSTQVSVDGLVQAPGASNDYVEFTSTQVQMTYALEAGQQVVIFYQSA